MSDLSNDLARELMRRIITGEYPPGSTLPKEADMCESSCCSRVVVREAKKRLQALGMVRPLKHMGSYVLPRQDWNFFSSELFAMYLEAGEDVVPQLENFYSLRLLLEPELSAEVAKNHSATFENDMRIIMARLEEAHKNPADDEVLRIDLDYHMRIYQESQNILLMPLAKLMRSFFLFSFRHARSEWSMGFVEHKELLDAILDHDPEKAREKTALLISNGRKRFRAEIEQQIKEGIALRFTADEVLNAPFTNK